MSRALPHIGDSDGGVIARWLWRGYLREHLPIILFALLLMSIEGGTIGLLSYMVKPMFDEVFVGANSGAATLVGLVILGAFLLRSVSGFTQRILMARVGLKVSAALQRDMVGHMLALDSVWFQDNAPGNLIERVRGDTQQVSNIWSSVLTAAGRDVIALVSLFAVALSINWVWTLLALVAAPLLIFPVAILQRLVRSTSRIARSSASFLSTRLDEIFHGIDTIKLNTNELRDRDRFDRTLDDFIGAQLRATAGRSGIPAMMDIAAGIGFFGVLTYGGTQIIEGEVTVGEFMSFFTAMALVFDPLRRLGNVAGTWQTALASLERIHAVFEAQPTILSPARPKGLDVPPRTADVVLEDVHFAYGDLPVLDGVSLTAEAGKVTALVGPSGAGKTTVFRLLTRLADPVSGRVTIGGTDLRDLPLATLRDLYSVVTQDAALFDETIRDNILLGRPGADPEALDRALRVAHVDDFVATMTAGLDSAAGPRGANLSGGQRQRVAIARAVLRDAPILLMDEPTSALDARSEAVVQEALENLSANRTTLVIAHRLSTVRDADRIVVMDKGRVVDQGTHDELIARDGIYAGLYRLQFGGT
ncbi:ABC transporter ATP-binding protein [Rhodovulum sp. YNF3179]|uniref:ABC transporter ATP-binding protein n=1 Tax=Rhodovulum sp. YNF3179 TaxID=3425127 RepID=UPI003D3591D8